MGGYKTITQKSVSLYTNENILKKKLGKGISFTITSRKKFSWSKSKVKEDPYCENFETLGNGKSSHAHN